MNTTGGAHLTGCCCEHHTRRISAGVVPDANPSRSGVVVFFPRHLFLFSGTASASVPARTCKSRRWKRAMGGQVGSRSAVSAAPPSSSAAPPTPHHPPLSSHVYSSATSAPIIHFHRSIPLLFWLSGPETRTPPPSPSSIAPRLPLQPAVQCSEFEAEGCCG